MIGVVVVVVVSVAAIVGVSSRRLPRVWKKKRHDNLCTLCLLGKNDLSRYTRVACTLAGVRVTLLIFNTRIKFVCHTKEEVRVALLSELCLLQRCNEFD